MKRCFWMEVLLWASPQFELPAASSVYEFTGGLLAARVANKILLCAHDRLGRFRNGQ
jgi:hypothetical protein